MRFPQYILLDTVVEIYVYGSFPSSRAITLEEPPTHLKKLIFDCIRVLSAIDYFLNDFSSLIRFKGRCFGRSSVPLVV